MVLALFLHLSQYIHFQLMELKFTWGDVDVLNASVSIWLCVHEKNKQDLFFFFNSAQFRLR